MYFVVNDECKHKMGVYRIINTVNNKIYIGSTTSGFYTRYTCHKSDLKLNEHHSILLQRAWNKYGELSFDFEILEIVESKLDTLKKEQEYLDKFESYNSNIGYNIAKYADGGINNVILNIEQCLEIKNIMLDNKYKHNLDKKLLAEKYNISTTTLDRIWYGKYSLSNEIGGGAKDWGKENLRNWNFSITVVQANEIKKMLLENTGESFSKKYRRISSIYKCSVDVIKSIKLGKHSYSTKLGGKYEDW